jgi:dTDP-L-rhamnose 4-epimerase
VARANVAALEAPPSITGAFNIASGQPHTIGDLAQGLFDTLGHPGLEPVVTGEWRLGDVRHIVASPQKAIRELGFVAQVPFEAGLSELVNQSDVID